MNLFTFRLNSAAFEDILFSLIDFNSIFSPFIYADLISISDEDPRFRVPFSTAPRPKQALPPGYRLNTGLQLSTKPATLLGSPV